MKKISRWLFDFDQASWITKPAYINTNFIMYYEVIEEESSLRGTYTLLIMSTGRHEYEVKETPEELGLL